MMLSEIKKQSEIDNNWWPDGNWVGGWLKERREAVQTSSCKLVAEMRSTAQGIQSIMM